VFGQEMTGPSPGFFFFLAQTRPDTLQEVIRRIQFNLRRISREGIPQQEFELAKQKLIASHAMQNVTPQSQAFQAAVDELLGLGYLHDRSYDQRIEQVQPADVQNLVAQHFQRAIIATSAPAEASSASASASEKPPAKERANGSAKP
jgi:predicted Zn-dependent peptidase